MTKKKTNVPPTLEERLESVERLLHEVLKRLDKPQKLAYNATEAAEALGVSTRLVYDLMHQETFPVSLKLKGRRMISRELLEEWVVEQAGGHRLESTRPCSSQKKPRNKRIVTLDLDGLIERYDREALTN